MGVTARLMYSYLVPRRVPRNLGKWKPALPEQVSKEEEPLSFNPRYLGMRKDKGPALQRTLNVENWELVTMLMLVCRRSMARLGLLVSIRYLLLWSDVPEVSYPALESGIQGAGLYMGDTASDG